MGVNKSYILKAFKEIKKVLLEIEMGKALAAQGLNTRMSISTIEGMHFYEGQSIFIF